MSRDCKFRYNTHTNGMDPSVHMQENSVAKARSFLGRVWTLYQTELRSKRSCIPAQLKRDVSSRFPNLLKNTLKPLSNQRWQNEANNVASLRPHPHSYHQVNADCSHTPHGKRHSQPLLTQFRRRVQRPTTWPPPRRRHLPPNSSPPTNPATSDTTPAPTATPGQRSATTAAETPNGTCHAPGSTATASSMCA